MVDVTVFIWFGRLMQQSTNFKPTAKLWLTICIVCQMKILIGIQYTSTCKILKSILRNIYRKVNISALLLSRRHIMLSNICLNSS